MAPGNPQAAGGRAGAPRQGPPGTPLYSSRPPTQLGYYSGDSSSPVGPPGACCSTEELRRKINFSVFRRETAASASRNILLTFFGFLFARCMKRSLQFSFLFWLWELCEEEGGSFKVQHFPLRGTLQIWCFFATVPISLPRILRDFFWKVRPIGGFRCGKKDNFATAQQAQQWR